jgi:hypothetical protein
MADGKHQITHAQLVWLSAHIHVTNCHSGQICGCNAQGSEIATKTAVATRLVVSLGHLRLKSASID